MKEPMSYDKLIEQLTLCTLDARFHYSRLINDERIKKSLKGQIKYEVEDH